MNQPTNHRIVVSRRGGPEELQVVESDLSVPTLGEVRVKVSAAGVSGYDVMLRSRSFPGFTSVPYAPGEDAVGVVDALGEGVSTLEVGQRVACWTFGRGGGYAEFICSPATEWVPVPSGLDSAAAVCLVVNYLTAYMALHRTAKVQRGERILVQGAAGGVGSALLDLARQAGVEAYGTASLHNHEFVSSFGAKPIDYRAEDFVESIRSSTGDGVDAVFDLVGGGRQLRRSYRALRRGGRLVMLGMAAASKVGTRVIVPSLLTVALLKLIPDGKRLPLSPGMEDVSPDDDPWYRDTLTALFAAAEVGELTPVVAARIPLVEAARAHELLERGGHTGKVVLVTGA